MSPERAGNIVHNQSDLESQITSNTRSAQRHQQNLAEQFRRESISSLAALKMRIGDIAGRSQPVPSDVLGEIERTVSGLVPRLDLELLRQHPYARIVRADGTEVGNPTGELSSGEAETITVAIDLLTKCFEWKLLGVADCYVLIDEPDVHLHPDQQARFGGFIRQLAVEFEVRVVVATHSTTFLAALAQHGSNEVRVAFLSTAETELTAVPMTEARRLMANLLGGHALMGPLFGVPILLVEGGDDYEAWSEVPRHPESSGLFSVVPCGGEPIRRHQRALEHILEAVREPADGPAGFALIDGDRGMPTDAAQAHIQYLQLNCHETENLYLTDEVLAVLGTRWADARQAIVAAAFGFKGDVEADLRAALSWDRQKVDLKRVIRVLPGIIDPKNVRWTQRVGQALGRQRPEGQLAEFLGDATVASLWPQSS